MYSILLLEICLFTSASNNLLLHDQNQLSAPYRYARKPGGARRPRHRRVNSSTPTFPFRRRRRTQPPASHLRPIVYNGGRRRALQSFPRFFIWTVMATAQVPAAQVRHRGASLKSRSLDAAVVGESSSMEPSNSRNCSITSAEVAPAPCPGLPGGAPIPTITSPPSPPASTEDFSPPAIQSEFALHPWTPVSARSETFLDAPHHLSRSYTTPASTRNANRLALTLPIAPANSLPSRPTPTHTISIPPTPTESLGSGMASPTDPNDFIVAIAAQERRVMELREELTRAEDELKTLQTRWNSSEAHKIRAAIRNRDSYRPRPPVSPSPSSSAGDKSPAGITPAAAPAIIANRRSLDIETKKALLLNGGTPKEHKRRVLRGGHTRALSLLSPTRSEADASIFRELEGMHSSQQFTPAPLHKRATWAPRQSPPPNGMKQIAQDLRQGLWTFVEDIRQATVGDEGISATSNRTCDWQTRTGADQDTIRPSPAPRRRIPFSPEPLIDLEIDTPSKPPTESYHDRAAARGSTKAESKTRKHFSWTPLTFDDMGDDDWSNWDASSVKTSRWSGTTVNGDIIPAIPEKLDDSDSSL